MMEKAINEAHRAIDAGKAGVVALLLWHDEIVALNHNRYVKTGDMTAHGEMVVLHSAAAFLNTLSAEDKAHLTIYVTLEPCLMCLSAIFFVGIKRVVYAALAENANAKELIARGLTAECVNPCLHAAFWNSSPASYEQRDANCWHAWGNSASRPVASEKGPPDFRQPSPNSLSPPSKVRRQPPVRDKQLLAAASQ